MDHVALNFKVSKNNKFYHWRELEEHFRNSLIEIGLHAAIKKLTMHHVWNIEHRTHNNVISSTSNLRTNTITKLCRIADSTILEKIYDDFLIENDQLIKVAATRGIEFDIKVNKNIESELELIKNTMSSIEVVKKINKFPLLQNIEPLHVEHTHYGVVYIKNDFVEVWFDTGYIYYLYDIGLDLHNNLYYPMYKNASSADGIRFAYSRMNDFEGCMSVAAPAGDCGISCLYESIDTEYLKIYINEVSEIINMWKKYTARFPNDPIRLENRAKDFIGYYYKFLGNRLDHSLTDFIELQLMYIDQLIGYLNNPLIDQTAINQYAQNKLV
jgi:hypothetical protein